MRREHINISSDYMPLQYIESTGTQYINTGVLDGENLDFELTVKQRNTNSNWMFFGARYGNRNDEETLLWAISDNPSQPLRLGYKSTWYYASFSAETWHTIKMEGNKLYIDGSLAITFTKSTFSRKYPVYLFAVNLAGASSYSNLICFSAAKLWDNGNLVRNYVPMLRRLDSKSGFYDLVNNQFYTNAGTGEFLYA